MSVSRLLLDMVAGTPVADPENEPWPGGNTSQLYSLGHTITSIRERPAWRLPTPDETEALRIPGGVPVIVITRQTYVNDWVAEVAHIVMRSDRVELDYLIHLS
ncbi:UTRA domain-containing protein [Micromonospora sp. NPDC050784]|uniref:UTRA domain-containing protein n=1 Tax=Micromonospora sp. NPDC050784 TaxID=3364281 RepID=UPI00378733B1